MKKAIAVYLDDSDKMETEFSWLYKTWTLYSLEKEYDLVVYYNPTALPRLEKFEGIITIPMPYTRMAPSYKFLNSHYFCLPEHCEPLTEYDYLMKTDCDVFLTKHMKGYVPSKFMVGEGGYYQTDNATKVDFIKKACEALGLRYHYLTGIGASFFSTAKQVINVTASQARITEIVLSSYFKETSDHPSGFNNGIASMIAGEMIINHCFSNQHVVLYALDSKCWKTTEMGNDVLHIHAWHTSLEWSKHKFFDGKYADWNVSFADAFDNAANYCHWVATTPLEEIKKYKKHFE